MPWLDVSIKQKSGESSSRVADVEVNKYKDVFIRGRCSDVQCVIVRYVKLGPRSAFPAAAKRRMTSA